MAHHSRNPIGVNRGINWNNQPLGQVPDLELAKRLNVSENAVRTQRIKMKIPAHFIARKALFEQYARERETLDNGTAMSWEYVAGFFDGEGSVAGSKNRSKGSLYNNIRIVFVNTNKEVLEKIKKFLGIGNIRTQVGSNPLSKKPCYYLRISGRKILPILELLSKKCIVKRRDLDKTINYIQRTIETEKRGRLPYKDYVFWLNEKMGFTKEQISQLYGVSRQAVIACLQRGGSKNGN